MDHTAYQVCDLGKCSAELLVESIFIFSRNLDATGKRERPHTNRRNWLNSSWEKSSSTCASTTVSASSPTV